MRRRERGRKEENMMMVERAERGSFSTSCVGGGASQTEMGGLWQLQVRRGRRGRRAAMYAKARKQRNSPPGPVFLQTAVSNMV